MRAAHKRHGPRKLGHHIWANITALATSHRKMTVMPRCGMIVRGVEPGGGGGVRAAEHRRGDEVQAVLPVRPRQRLDQAGRDGGHATRTVPADTLLSGTTARTAASSNRWAPAATEPKPHCMPLVPSMTYPGASAWVGQYLTPGQARRCLPQRGRASRAMSARLPDDHNGGPACHSRLRRAR